MIKLNSKLRNLLGTHGQIPVQNTNTPIFITGCMRSGTTFLVDQVTSHPQLLKIGSELNEIWNDIGGASTKGSCDYKSKEDANGYYTYQMSNYFFQFINESKTLKRHLMRANILWSRRLGRIRYDWKNIIPVNKSPHLINKIEYVDALFPKSKFLYIIRDIYAHSASMKVHFDNVYQKHFVLSFYPDDFKSCWTAVLENEVPENLQDLLSYPPNFGLIPKMWIRLNHVAFNSLDKIDKDQYLVICYEDLINNQKEIFKKVFQFLSLDKKHSQHEVRIMNSNITYKNTITKGNPLKKWKTNLSEKETALIEEAIKENQKTYDFVLKKLSQLKI